MLMLRFLDVSRKLLGGEMTCKMNGRVTDIMNRKAHAQNKHMGRNYLRVLICQSELDVLLNDLHRGYLIGLNVRRYCSSYF